MKDYVFCIVGKQDTGYSDAAGFALPAYDSPLLHSIRQAFPNYACVFRFGQLLAACGFRGADGGLFLEQFMETPADDHIASCTGVRVPRSAIVELGAFRVLSPALIPRFAAFIESTLRERGFSHVLVLSPSGASSVTAWCRERASLSVGVESGRHDGATQSTLEVRIIPLATNR